MELSAGGPLELIQLSITPVILISGLGALVISMTNRMGRIVDRTRLLAGLARQANDDERGHLVTQLKVMFRRAKLMRLAMTLIVSSMFVSGLLITLIFLSALTELQLAAGIFAVFLVSVVLMLGGLAAFVADLWVSLVALDSDVRRALGPEAETITLL
ncbi:MAG: DUF2721 domain-containing protein [Opitutaceae bacterium]|nr:DUF2721 domain-containing protein [Opitutaceae bacterium]